MKRKLVLVVLVSLFITGGCGTFKYVDTPQKSTIIGFDFTPYAEKGFLFTPFEYPGDYEGLGAMVVTVEPKIAYKKGDIPDGSNFSSYGFFAEDGMRYTQMIGLIDPVEALDEIYEFTTNKGGDAFVDFKYRMEFEENDSHHYGYLVLVIEGVAIKRK